MADVDTDVPKEAQKQFRAGMRKLEQGDSAQAITALRSAVKIYPSYYAGRLELGRELRLQKHPQEALEVIHPLLQIAPKRAEPRVEMGIILLALDRRQEAISQLDAALGLVETNWAAHLYLGWALLESEGQKAEAHFRRALELDEQKAARAHLSLARLADGRGERLLAIKHLDAYLALAPRAHDAEATRKLAEHLRGKN